MKIRNQKDVEILNQKIKDELGIDMKEYRNPEVIGNFVDMLVFPKYAANWTIRPLIASFILFIAGFFFVDLVHIEYLLYSFPGVFLFLINGLFFGLLYLTWKIKDDIQGLVEYSLGVLKSCVQDLNKVGITVNKENRGDIFGLLFKGVIHIVTIPVLSGVVSGRIPFVGRFVQGLIKRTLTVFADKVSFDTNLEEIDLEEKNSESRALALYAQSIGGLTKGLNKVLGLTIGVVQLPIKLFFGITFSLLWLFLYLIW